MSEPHWKSERWCDHGGFVGTVRTIQRGEIKHYDVYIYGAEQQLCIRFGNEDREYSSCDRVVDFLFNRDHTTRVPLGLSDATVTTLREEVFRLLLEEGSFWWRSKEDIHKNDFMNWYCSS
jgi:hypothetical protein